MPNPTVLVSRVLSVALLFPCLVGTAISAERPNILWLFSDDHAVNSVGAYGGHASGFTPNLDRLAAGGVTFDRAYVANSICAPSRATLLTGKHSHKNSKFTNKSNEPFDHDQPQVQKYLRESGYRTAMIGKIHLNGAMQGFDHWEVLKGQGRYEDPILLSENGSKTYEGHSSDVVTDIALEWLDDAAERPEPFFAMVHYKAPHRWWLPSDRWKKKLEGVESEEPASLFDDYSGRGFAAGNQDMSIEETMSLGRDLKADIWPERAELFAGLEGRELVRTKFQAYMRDYVACVAGMDENIGRLLDWLDETGLAENTVVMYSSDQGFYLGEHGWFDKRFMYEESFRTPLIARWPGVTDPGSRCDALVQNIDYAETFLEIAGVDVPGDMQGRGLTPLLKGEAPADWRDSLYYHYYEYPRPHRVVPHEGVFDGRFKLIRFYHEDVPGGEEWELYDLETDPNEMRSVYQDPAMADRVATLKTELARLRDFYDVPADHGWSEIPADQPKRKQPKAQKPKRTKG
ncbi:MAG: sulfatase [Planctomycetota bacterium]